MRSPVLTEKEEKQMSKLRQKLFESNWDSAEFKASVRDLVSACTRAFRGMPGIMLCMRLVWAGHVGNSCTHARMLPTVSRS